MLNVLLLTISILLPLATILKASFSTGISAILLPFPKRSIEVLAWSGVTFFVFIDYFEKHIDVLEVLEWKISHQVSFINLFTHLLLRFVNHHSLFTTFLLPFLAVAQLNCCLVLFLLFIDGDVRCSDLNDIGLTASKGNYFPGGWLVMSVLRLSIELSLILKATSPFLMWKHLLPTFRI